MKNLYKVRKEKNMSQTALSVKLGVSQEVISSYENGKSYPSVENLIKLCDILKVSSDYLLDRSKIKLTIDEFCKENLSLEESELLENFRKLSPLKRNRALGIIIGMSENQS